MIKYLLGLLAVVVIVALSLGFVAHKKTSHLLISRDALEREVSNLNQMYQLETMAIQPESPGSIEDTYNKLQRQTDLICGKLGIEARIEVPHLPDFSTISKHIKASPMRGVKSIEVSLTSSTNYKNLLHLISEIQHCFPVLLDKIDYTRTAELEGNESLEVVLTLYGT